MEETWKLLEEYPNYEVSTLGRVRRLYGDGSFEIVEPYSDFEVVKVKLDNYRGVEEVALAWLVMGAFDPYRGPGGWSPIVYLDEDPWNCSLDNMRWKKKNMRTAYEKQEKEYAEGHKIYCYENERVYNTASEASDDLGIDRSSITKCCLGIYAAAGGYTFAYAKDKDDGPKIKKTLKKVYCKNIIDGSIRIFNSVNDACEELRLPSIKKALSGHCKTTGNYIVSYNKDDVL
jgi:hypothetical protein